MAALTEMNDISNRIAWWMQKAMEYDADVAELSTSLRRAEANAELAHLEVKALQYERRTGKEYP